MPKIQVYSTPNCPYCKEIKKFFASVNIEFEDINVAENMLKAEEMVKKSGQMGVPVIDIDGQIIVGVNKLKIKEILHIS